jgi:hypothetical protein
MPNGRFVSKSISANEQLADVSLAADYFFQRCIPHLDVDGRITGNAKILKGAVFPLRSEITAESIPDLIRELGAAVDAAGQSLVVWYEVGTQKVLWFPRFRDHQRGMKKDREAPSRLPPIAAATNILVGQASIRSESGVDQDQGRQKVSEGQGEGEVQDQSKGEAVDLDQVDRRRRGRRVDRPSRTPRNCIACCAGIARRTSGSLFRTERAARAARAATASSAACLSPIGRSRLARTCARRWARSGALLERGDYVRAVDAAHLDETCKHRVLSNGVRTPDAAFRLVLLELQKTWQETKAAREKAERGEEPARITGDGAPTPIGRVILPPAPIDGAPEAESWLGRLSVTEGGRRMAEVERLVRSRAKANTAPSERERMRTQALVEVWRAATQPKPATEGAA